LKDAKANVRPTAADIMRGKGGAEREFMEEAPAQASAAGGGSSNAKDEISDIDARLNALQDFLKTAQKK